MSLAAQAIEHLERRLGRLIERVAPFRATATAAATGLVTIQRPAASAETEQYARLDGFDIANGDELLCFSVPSVDGQGRVTTSKPVCAKLLRSAPSSRTLSGDLVLNGHLVGPATGPSIAAGAAAGAGPTISILGNDNWGRILITPGTSPTTGTLATITFGQAKPDTGYDVLLTPLDIDAAGAIARVHPSINAGTDWSITVGTSALGIAQHVWAYLVLER